MGAEYVSALNPWGEMREKARRALLAGGQSDVILDNLMADIDQYAARRIQEWEPVVPEVLYPETAIPKEWAQMFVASINDARQRALLANDPYDEDYMEEWFRQAIEAGARERAKQQKERAERGLYQKSLPHGISGAPIAD